MNRKILTLLILSILLISNVTIIATSKSVNTNEKDIDEKEILNLAVDDEGEKYAVIVGVGDYKGSQNDLSRPDVSANRIYKQLISKDWKSENIKLLLNSDAKKQIIFEELDELAQKSTENDVILFTYAGHGTTLKDSNGDERFDQAIVPYCENFISDDELNTKLSQITSKGQFIIIDSCFSGGFDELAEEAVQAGSYDEVEDRVNEIFTDCTNHRDAFINTLTTNEIKRVVLMSSLPFSMGVEIATAAEGWVDVTDGVANAIEQGKTTAEDISEWTINWWNSFPEVKSLYLYRIIMAINPYMDIIDIIFYLLTGQSLLPFPVPNMVDGYSPGELPIINLGQDHSVSKALAFRTLITSLLENRMTIRELIAALR